MSVASDKFNIGIDFGGVLSLMDTTGAEHVDTCINMPLAVENLLKLKALGHKLFLISFCGQNRAMETKQSLETTMISGNVSCASLFDGIYFVKEKKFKRPMCEYLNCHFMIDDRAGILADVQNSACKTIPILFGHSEHGSLTSASDWNIVTSIIESSPYFSTKLLNTKLKVKRPVELLHKV